MIKPEVVVHQNAPTSLAHHPPSAPTHLSLLIQPLRTTHTLTATTGMTLALELCRR
eukprot:m.383236 g.383236  ORF g.383236 m.383236 type:complete len:56 (-) comp16728_c0_seq14:116-283(-)